MKKLYLQSSLTDCKSLTSPNEDPASHEASQIVIRGEALDEGSDDCDSTTERHSPSATRPISLRRKSQVIFYECILGRHWKTHEWTREEPSANNSSNWIRGVDQADHIGILDMSDLPLSFQDWFHLQDCWRIPSSYPIPEQNWKRSNRSPSIPYIRPPKVRCTYIDRKNTATSRAMRYESTDQLYTTCLLGAILNKRKVTRYRWRTIASWEMLKRYRAGCYQISGFRMQCPKRPFEDGRGDRSVFRYLCVAMFKKSCSLSILLYCGRLYWWDKETSMGCNYSSVCQLYNNQ